MTQGAPGDEIRQAGDIDYEDTRRMVDKRVRQNYVRWGDQRHGSDRWLTILVQEVGKLAQALNHYNAVRIEEQLIDIAAVAITAHRDYTRPFIGAASVDEGNAPAPPQTPTPTHALTPDSNGNYNYPVDPGVYTLHDAAFQEVGHVVVERFEGKTVGELRYHLFWGADWVLAEAENDTPTEAPVDYVQDAQARQQERTPRLVWCYPVMAIQFADEPMMSERKSAEIERLLTKVRAQAEAGIARMVERDGYQIILVEPQSYSHQHMVIVMLTVTLAPPPAPF